MNDLDPFSSPRLYGKYVVYHAKKPSKRSQQIVDMYFSKSNGKNAGTLAKVFVETSTKKNRRDDLVKAVNYCNKQNATLLVPQLNQLAFETVFLNVCMDLDSKTFETANFLKNDKWAHSTIGVQTLLFSSMEKNALKSNRITNALRLKKVLGHKLGSPTPKTGANIAKVINIALADEYADRVITEIMEIKRHGKKVTLEQIALALTKRGIRTRRGGRWTATTVRNILVRTNNL